MAYCILWICVYVGLSAAEYNTCPAGSSETIRGVFGTPRYAQRGIWHVMTCPEFRSGETLDGVIWYKGESMSDQSKVRLISRYFGKVLPGKDGFEITLDFRLIIQDVVQEDEGRYLCLVSPSDSGNRFGQIDINVIGDTFPPSSSEELSAVSFQRGGRQMLPCQCASESPDTPSVVYWSMGEGVTTDTEIIGARFSDGTTLQIQHGADYSIGSDASLTVNSLTDLHDNQRFWCHAFQSDGTFKNCYTDVDIKGENGASNALRASETSFYLQEGLRQILPCISWASGTATCEVQWLKVDNSDQLLLSYNLSTNQVQTATGFNLAIAFGLEFVSAADVHGGRYKCSPMDNENVEEIDVHLIGDQFPLDDGEAIRGNTSTFGLNRKLTLTCPATLNISLTTRAIVLWSYGKPHEKTTTVVGKLTLPDGTRNMSDLGDKGCFGITYEGSLVLNKCSQDSDVRYWCHVFPDGDVVVRSYQDLVSKAVDKSEPFSVVLMVTLCSFIAMIILACVCIVKWRRFKPLPHSGQRIEEYMSVPKMEDDYHLDLTTLISEVKTYVKKELSILPITPWAWDEVDKADMDGLYTPPDLFVNVHSQGGGVRYKLKSESELFTDCISHFASDHVLIQGLSGSGKTTFVHKVATDWALGREQTLLGKKKVVFVLPVKILTTAGKVGEAVVQYILLKDAEISADSINKYCKRNPSDVAIVVDGCKGENDIKNVLKIIKANDLLKCQLVMTIKDAKPPGKLCQEEKLRCITITGFSKANAEVYVQRLLQKTPALIRTSQMIGTASFKGSHENVAKDETNLDDRAHKYSTNGSASYAGAKQTVQSSQATESSPLPTAETELLSQNSCDLQESEVIGEEKNTSKSSDSPQIKNLEVAQTGDAGDSSSSDSEATHQGHYSEGASAGTDQNRLLDYLQAGFLTAEVKCLPVYLSVLCRYFFLTNGRAFKEFHPMGSLFFRLMRHILNTSSSGVLKRGLGFRWIKGKTRVGYQTKFTDDQLLLIQGLGKVAFEQIEKCEKPITFNSGDFEQSIINLAKQTGKLSSDDQELRDLAQTYLNGAIKMGILCRTEQALAKSDNDRGAHKDDSSESLNCSVSFVLEIFEDLCAGIYVNLIREQKQLLVGKIVDLSVHDPKKESAIIFASKNQHGIKVTFAELEIQLKRPMRSPGALATALRFQKIVNFALQLIFEGKQKNDPDEMLHFLGLKGKVCLIGISSHKIRCLSYFLRHAKKSFLKSIELFRIERDAWPKLEEYFDRVEPGVSESIRKTTYKTQLDPETSKQVREKVQSSSKDLPMFPSDQSDTSVLDTVQLFDLQELVESQFGECHSSSAGRILVQSLLRHEKLESIVLNGTILSSENLFALVGGVNKLKHLRQLDLRFNKEFDDDAFRQVAKALNGCRSLIDLRLSLYKVTVNGFQEVGKEMQAWRRLEKLYLLHGTPLNCFVEFLSNSLRYFEGTKCIHISCRDTGEKLPCATADTFMRTVDDPHTLPHLRELVICNIGELKQWAIHRGLQGPQ
ncbi:uncharacterized protein LOC110975455 [Acanthaster planci]|uniref:Uncharacterized protein LOC110975455 n=1 Tax=Acanthaster planci TaxID=133434 RepID=A0A8B7XTV5_ACAPL|nr:uncharacterized protein LOC110975455 [Acanthaster planci]XP_022083662.1 uncharacterized protein LOC110975455 [Acanthaster planci]